MFKLLLIKDTGLVENLGLCFANPNPETNLILVITQL